MSPAEEIAEVRKVVSDLRTRDFEIIDKVCDCLGRLANVCESLINQPTFRPGDPVMDKQAAV